MNKFARDYFLSLYESHDEDYYILLSNLDAALTSGEINDFGRLYQCKLDWNLDPAREVAADEFGELAEALYELGKWYCISKKAIGSKPDKDSIPVERVMEVWRVYIADLYDDNNNFDLEKTCEKNNITGFCPVYLLSLVNKYLRFCVGCCEKENGYSAINSVVKELAAIYLINRFAIKVERIDILMNCKTDRSLFKECEEFTFAEFERMACYFYGTEKIRPEDDSWFFDDAGTDSVG